jgi:hypothetical protein
MVQWLEEYQDLFNSRDDAAQVKKFAEIEG